MTAPVVEEILTPVYRSNRGITQQTMEKFGVKTLVDSNGKSVKEVYPYPSGGNKIRLLPKTFYAENLQADELFGMDLFNAGSSRTITITEGETDCMSAYQMLSDSQYSNPVVSLPSASPSKRLWEKCKPYLDSFEKIILSVDNDDPGNRVAEQIYRIFPGKVYRVPHSKFKDANEFLTEGAAKDFKSAWFNAQKMKPEGFTSSPDEWAKVLEEETPYSYVASPIEDYNKKGRGFVKGGVTVIKAPPGSGKTSYFRFFQHHLIKNSDCKIAILHMEEMKSVTIRGLVTYELGVNVQTREDAEANGVTEERIQEVARELTSDNRFISFDVDSSDPITSVIESINLAVSVYGVDYVFIDHLQRLAYLAGVENATAGLTELAVKLVDMSKKYNFGVIAISHVNETGSSKYAKSIEEEAIVVMEIERDKMSENKDERNTSHLTITKNRPFSLLGPAGMLKYDPDTTILSEKRYEV